MLGARGLYWQYSSPQTDYALILNSDNLTTSFDNNHYRNNDDNYHWGYQVFLNVSMTNNGNFGLTYTDYSHHTNDAVSHTLVSSLNDSTFFPLNLLFLL